MVDQLFEDARVGDRGFEFFGPASSLITASKDADFAKRTVSKTCLESTKPDGAGSHGSLAGGKDQRRGHVERVFLGSQPARRLDFAQLLLRRHAQAERLLERRSLGVARIDQINPGRHAASDVAGTIDGIGA